MINRQNLGSKESVGVRFKEGICAELCLKLWSERDWHFVILQVTMVLKATLQKESSKQSLPKVTSEAAIRRCSSK